MSPILPGFVGRNLSPRWKCRNIPRCAYPVPEAGASHCLFPLGGTGERQRDMGDFSRQSLVIPGSIVTNPPWFRRTKPVPTVGGQTPPPTSRTVGDQYCDTPDGETNTPTHVPQ